MNSINGGHLVWISGVYKQHPAPRLETKCQTGAPSSLPHTCHFCCMFCRCVFQINTGVYSFHSVNGFLCGVLGGGGGGGMAGADPGFEKGGGAGGSGSRPQDLLGQFGGLFEEIGAKMGGRAAPASPSRSSPGWVGTGCQMSYGMSDVKKKPFVSIYIVHRRWRCLRFLEFYSIQKALETPSKYW